MPTVNEALQDAANRHQVYLLRYGGSTARKVIELLQEMDADLVARIQARISRLGPVERQKWGRGLATTQRMERLLGQIREQNERIIGAVKGLTDEQLEALVDAELKIATDRINEAIGADLNILRPSPEQLRAAVEGVTMRGNTLSQWFTKLSEDRLRQIDGAVRMGFLQGETIPQIARRLRQAVELSHRSANTLARTSVNAVANQARDYLYQANDDLVKEVKWVSTLDSRTSAICAARDGKTYPVDSGPRPPAHPNCLPGDSLILPGGRISRASKRWFDGKIVVIRTAAGRELRATPNHPVLTNRGWVGAQFIDVGDKLICDDGSEGASSLLYAGHKDVEAPIHQVAEAFFSSGNVSTMPVPTAAPDFHGDGIDGEVAIIGTNCGLHFETDISLAEKGGNFPFQCRNAGFGSLLASGTSFQLGWGVTEPADSFVCSTGERSPLFGTSAGHSGELLLGSIAELDAPLFQDSFDRTWADAEALRDAANTNTGGVEFDDVAFVEMRDFSDHVYNLETENHLIISGGIVTHNCRSTITPVLKSWDELAKPGRLKPGRGGADIDKIFRRKLREQGFSPDKIRQIRRNTRASMNGQVPRDTTYESWLRRQPAEFQDDVLGQTKGALFRRGGMSLDKFVDMRTGREFTIDELRAKNAEAFMRANIGDDIVAQTQKQYRAYHGAEVEFTAFDEARIGTSTDSGFLGRGFYLSTDINVGRTSPVTLAADVKLRNPLRLEMKDFRTDKRKLISDALNIPKGTDSAKITEILKKRGHDGVVLDYSPTGYEAQEIMVIDAKNIKILGNAKR